MAENIREGNVFIYPTDTLYGLGCDATNEESVERIKSIKERDRDKPLSVIAPHLDWIRENFYLEDVDLDKYLPGPYTLLLKKKNPKFLFWISPNDRVGVRIPNFEVCSCIFIGHGIEMSERPIVTTSVNLSGEKPAVKISEVSKDIINKVDFFIKAKDERKLSGKPSTIVIDGKEMGRK